MKERIKEFGEFNGWRGCLGLYFTQKQLRTLKQYGITAATTLKEAYNIINNKSYDTNTTIKRKGASGE